MLDEGCQGSLKIMVLEVTMNARGWVLKITRNYGFRGNKNPPLKLHLLKRFFIGRKATMLQK